jgi:cytosine/adenosine deaminase-related metal-dependent hydrolase
MRLGSGVCRVRDLRAAGAPVGLAVDGSASNDTSNMLAELRQSLLLHRVVGGASAMTVLEVLEMATLGGAACLGRDDVGTIEPGRACDLALWDLGDLGCDAVGDRAAALLLSPPPRARLVVVGGTPIEVP